MTTQNRVMEMLRAGDIDGLKVLAWEGDNKDLVIEEVFREMLRDHATAFARMTDVGFYPT